MKTHIAHKYVKTLMIIGAGVLFALPLHAGRGGNGSGGNAGVCPQGFTPGTRNTQSCTPSQDGSGSKYGYGKTEDRGSGSSQKSQAGARDGSGQKSGNRNGGGNGQGTGDPANCPNVNP